MEGITKRWIDGPTSSDQDWKRLEQIVDAKGWMSLPRDMSRVLVAEDSDRKLVGFNVFQGIPFCGPLFVNREWRGSGLAEDLNDEMVHWLTTSKARGWLVIAESKFVEQYCEKIDMERVKSPVYIKVGMTGTGG
jgi:Acetyltransferase (GNAT) domain